MSTFGFQIAGSGPAMSVKTAVWELALGVCSRGLLMILALCGWLGSVRHALLNILPDRAKRRIGCEVPTTSTVRTAGSREFQIFPRGISQAITIARNATQTAISQAPTILSLLVVVGGCLGLLGIVLSPVSAHPNAAPVDAFHPIDVPLPGKTIRNDRHPRRPATWAVAYPRSRRDRGSGNRLGPDCDRLLL